MKISYFLNMFDKTTSELKNFGFEIINHLQESIYLIEVFDNDLFILSEVNATFEKRMERPMDQCIGKSIDQFFDSVTASTIKKTLKHCASSNETTTLTLDLSHEDKNARFQHTFIPVKEDGKKTIRIIGIEKQLHSEPESSRDAYLQLPYFHEKSSLKSFIEKAPFGVILMNEEKPLYINHTLFGFIGEPYTRNFGSCKISDFVHPIDRGAITKLFHSILKDKKNAAHQITIRSAQPRNDDKYFDLYITSHFAQDVNLVHIVVVDISDEIEKEKLLNQLAFVSLLSTQKNEVFAEAYNELDAIIQESKLDRTVFERILSRLESYSNKKMDWNLFANHIENLCPNFITNLRIICPSLTANDVKHCACIRLNYDTKETAKFFNVTPTSIQTARVRLKKKLNIEENIDLREFIMNL